MPACPIVLTLDALKCSAAYGTPMSSVSVLFAVSHAPCIPHHLYKQTLCFPYLPHPTPPPQSPADEDTVFVLRPPGCAFVPDPRNPVLVHVDAASVYGGLLGPGAAAAALTASNSAAAAAAAAGGGNAGPSGNAAGVAPST